MAVRDDYEVYTQQKFTLPVTKAALDYATPEVGHACLAGDLGVGVVLSDEGDFVIADFGRSVYMQQVDCPVDAAGAVAEGQAIYYNASATGAPFLTSVPSTNVQVGIAVLADQDDSFPKGAVGTATVEDVAVLFNA